MLFRSTVLRSALPVLFNPFNLTKAISLSYGQFRYIFANELPETEAKELYNRFTVPSPVRPLFQAATATFNPSSETAVNTSNDSRGPLLITGGEKDHIVPPLLSKASLKKYGSPRAITEYKLFEGRGHSLVSDHGWKEIAEYSLSWLNKHGF